MESCSLVGSLKHLGYLVKVLEESGRQLTEPCVATIRGKCVNCYDVHA